ncbi:hypothetical protein K450DRAFT_253167 [Umbelopsis ramanniana AG]|uniref:Uncharacterized protein n=1 Tax=Umbelopsis ramanniana AG TaxID=1314678 RepID=A0AAD5E7Q2_UMBRA|nr:uncharacterized protein K450DRAFT_253167 [Umbelopsis ramanniana AG]KAI8577165.1 hypothetical protein K450DRAFT_253167 [Umbelopsis ramanniana AG]
MEGESDAKGKQTYVAPHYLICMFSILLYSSCKKLPKCVALDEYPQGKKCITQKKVHL